MASGARQDRSSEARGSTGEHISESLTQELSRLAREMQDETDPSRLLDLIVQAAVDDVPGAAHAAVTIASGKNARTLSTEATTSDLPAKVDQIQYVAGQGPCVESSWEHETLRSDDLAAEARWPEFVSAAAELGVRSMLSVQLFVTAESFGALNLYSEQPNGFDREDENVAIALAAHAAVAMSRVRKVENLTLALDSRDLIGQAKGILMERFRITPDTAFEFLVLASQRTHLKLCEVAHRLTETGTLPSERS